MGESSARASVQSEGRRNVVTGASEDGARSTSREENARVRKDENRLIRSAWGVVKRAMHLQGLATELARELRVRKAPVDHRTKRGCPSSKCRWQKLVARISGR